MFLDGNVFPPLIFFIPGLRQSSLLNGQKRETGRKTKGQVKRHQRDNERENEKDKKRFVTLL